MQILKILYNRNLRRQYHTDQSYKTLYNHNFQLWSHSDSKIAL